MFSTTLKINGNLKIGKVKFSILVIGAFWLVSCRPEPTVNIPDVSDIHVNVDLTRFDQLLMQDTTIDAIRIRELMTEYPAFSDVFFNHVMPGSEEPVINQDPELKIQNIQSWISHPRTRWLYDTVQQIFPKMDDLEKGLKEAFTYAKYYFPEKETPRFLQRFRILGTSLLSMQKTVLKMVSVSALKCFWESNFLIVRLMEMVRRFRIISSDPTTKITSSNVHWKFGWMTWRALHREIDCWIS
jgi:hypothetical protein